ncbi:MAG: iron-sulfur cluster assembly accessory protein [Paenibacillaceae bacterium]|jgi:iron-sulfur cluster assembly protein|nr:iron-sulfur cluster assembly accessory protein [Paenibacillaceae bacterium]
MNIGVSAFAARRIKEMMDAEGVQGMLRIRVQTGGCSGFTYALEFAEHKEAGDIAVVFDGVCILVDQESAPLIQGVQLDYKETELGGGFTIENPNAIASCGCGSSFRTREQAGVPSEC